MGTALWTVVTVALTVVAALVALVLVIGLLIAMGFFMSVIGYGWMRTIAPKEELEALPPERRRWVTVRAGIGAAILWLLLLGDTTSSSSPGRHMDGHETFAFFYKLLRRFAGLPPVPPEPVATPAPLPSPPSPT